VSAALQQVPLIDALGVRVDSAALAEQLRAELTLVASFAPRVLVGAASRVLTAVLVLVLSFYLLLEAESMGRRLDAFIPAEYADEWSRIKYDFAGIWSSFLRGQVLLALVIGIAVWVVLFILGVPNALFLGLLAGVMEVVPNIGPIIAMIPAVLIAFFQGSTRWAIDPATFAVVVIIAYILIQQFENHLIVPKIIGSSVNLPPVIILIGAFAGASLAGVLGIFLAAPVLATARLVGEFILRKLLEPDTESGGEKER
jgi:predicted PurR-regulated permease PerM